MNLVYNLSFRIENRRVHFTMRSKKLATDRFSKPFLFCNVPDMVALRIHNLVSVCLFVPQKYVHHLEFSANNNSGLCEKGSTLVVGFNDCIVSSRNFDQCVVVNVGGLRAVVVECFLRGNFGCGFSKCGSNTVRFYMVKNSTTRTYKLRS